MPPQTGHTPSFARFVAPGRAGFVWDPRGLDWVGPAAGRPTGLPERAGLNGVA